MSIFSNIANDLTNAGIKATSAADKPKVVHNPMQTAKNKLIERLKNSIKFAEANDNDAKKSCYTVKAGQAVIGAKYGNAYLQDADGNKFITVANDAQQIVTVLKTLINAVNEGYFDDELGKAVAREQKLAKARYAKRMEAKTSTNDNNDTKAKSLVPSAEQANAFANR